MIYKSSRSKFTSVLKSILIAANLTTHINHFESTVVRKHLDTEQVFDLTGEHVDGCPGGKSADQRIRHEGRQSAEPEAPKEQLSMTK